MINLNIFKTELTVMCELKVVFKGKIIIEDAVRITVDRKNITINGLLGDTKTIQGKIIDINVTKQEVIIEG
ncbi:MAG: CooT family nickel-binding protein [Candidatus Methanoperedens sp.]|nr:CooT family nickel-binding protein [Candidatus Methanoperedens sp.]MCE8428365.1 CooT family nickel-binding protein [Candidatus Methanoperedens sp.]